MRVEREWKGCLHESNAPAAYRLLPTAYCLVGWLAALAGGAQAGPFEVRKGEHISIIGNALAERMQHDGWLETLIQSRFPDRELSFRNLGFVGDELAIRARSEGFGTPDEWLTRTKADVVFAFFGFNESFAGPEGLPRFREELQRFIEQTRAQKYNGATPPRLVLFSPIAFENLASPSLPDGRQHNQRLEQYTQAMAEVAQAQKVVFVDLFTPTRGLYERTAEPLTINGIHLTELGNRLVAEAIDEALFGARPQAVSLGRLEPIRQAVCDKNFHWFHRYRTTDGYNVFGGRSNLRYTQGTRSKGYQEGLSNRDVMQREMEVLDAMAANRDRRIWSMARGADLSVDDATTPPFIPVQTNLPGPGPGGTHLFLGGEEAIGKMTVAQGMKVELFASEEQFPELINPVQMAFDTKGRLWVAAWPSYPHWKPKDPMNDQLLILEDSDGNGRADRCIVFADRLHNPTGFEFWGGGVLVAMAPDLLYLADSDGDDRADVRRKVLHGLDSADTHHTANSFVLGPCGALYFQEGVFHRTQIESPYGPLRNQDACVWRFDPRSWRVDRYIAYNFANPHGHVFDRWGQDIVHDGTGAQPFHAALFSGHLEHPQKHGKPPQVYQQRTRPCPGTEILSSRHFPDENQGNLLVGNVIGFQGILQYRIEERGASFAGVEAEPIISSTDPNFRPADLEVGPDGALYFTDWHNPIIGHMQHHIRDPNRNKTHGRVYRVTVAGRPLLSPAPIAGQPIEKLLDLLKEPENRVRYRARIELSGRPTGAVIAATRRWITGLDAKDPDFDHHLTEALWIHQGHDVVDGELLGRVLRARDHRARAAATRVLSWWGERVPDSLELVKKLAADENPLVRLEAVRAASFYRIPEAIEAPLIASDHPTDEYLDYTRGETMKALEPYWQKAVSEGRRIALASPAGMRFFLRSVRIEDLVKMEPSRAVYRELLLRDGVSDEHRRLALRGLAELDQKDELAVLLEAIGGLDEGEQGRSVVFDLVRLLTSRSSGELARARGELLRMATGAKLPLVRQIGYVALITADGDADPAWKIATESVGRLGDLLAAVPLFPDPSVRAALQPRIRPLLDGLPPNLAPAAGPSKGTYGRYVRIELPGPRRTLTLAEVEVTSGGVNIAPKGKATQKNTTHGGEARRAIDGNRSGNYSDGGQTHTQENIEDAWWELDLGEEQPIESIVVYNRTDGNNGRRLQGFRLAVLDGRRQPVFTKDKLPAPPVQAEFELAGAGPQGLVRRAAMTALTSIRGQEAQTFEALTHFIHADIDRLAAIRAIQRIPRQYWPADKAAPILEDILPYVRGIPVADRTGPAALDALQLGHALAAILPIDQAKRARAALGELGVHVVRIGTLPHHMAYDKEQLVVQAGRPVEIVFENPDLMPHNLVVTAPGALEEIGMQAEATARDPDSAERQFVPRSKKILLGSKLLGPLESQKLSFTAPKQAGVYPYVCTYPGHWRRMYGALYVVADLDEYLAAPESYLAAHPLPIQDDLLKFNRPRKEWKFEELAGALDRLAANRSFGNGKQIFQVANCVACHRLNGTGNQFGPDLAKLDPKWIAAEITREILDPSEKINEKFQTNSFGLESGAVVTGLVIEEASDVIKVVVNPLASTEPMVLKRSEIIERQRSKTSLMPKGLLDKLTLEEILDLVAYVTARGDQAHALFRGGHHDHGHKQ